MSKRGDRPAPRYARVNGAVPALPRDTGKVKVAASGWPRKRLVLRESPEGVAESVRATIGKLGYAPEDAFGICPDFTHRKIQFAWRKG
jgi:hypothetical protein